MLPSSRLDLFGYLSDPYLKTIDIINSILVVNLYSYIKWLLCNDIIVNYQLQNRITLFTATCSIIFSLNYSFLYSLYPKRLTYIQTH